MDLRIQATLPNLRFHLRPDTRCNGHSSEYLLRSPRRATPTKGTLHGDFPWIHLSAVRQHAVGQISVLRAAGYSGPGRFVSLRNHLNKLWVCTLIDRGKVKLFNKSFLRVIIVGGQIFCLKFSLYQNPFDNCIGTQIFMNFLNFHRGKVCLLIVKWKMRIIAGPSVTNILQNLI